ncbi:hypothetical protein GLOTRDRAFT_137042 [Gloeophyllum trabeum ATCC 11539]|uniref:Uncharacterized protein n=1 Tax=Gloeophyllum trabeum (strain ATCC 11539 / FP-39264 / Madison 617) TaxID=670483 RepID=S7QEQ0_GLOTA|nr:uncharacterized protein GLOTRDRAFT_137042 [Gloeophyllum trabeum ATCC 11539]EPQ58301.1 hypothetical protein GLOTRDRAFT_137042 [Gloeophyllum trabeum ATCC 11539]
MPLSSIRQRAEQGAHFIRTYFPDVDIPGELIREEIAMDARASQQLQEFDPYAGETLEIVECYDSSRKRGSCLAFPMGESKRDLNILPFPYQQKDRAMANPSPQPVKSFETPIVQLAGSSLGSATALGSMLAVRTFASTTLLEVKGKVTNGPIQVVYGVSAVAQGVVSHPEIGDRRVVDVKLRPTSNPELLFADDQGSIRTCRMGGGGNAIDVLHKASDSDLSASQDPFHRIALPKQADWFLVFSSNAVGRLDFRSIAKPSSVFSAPQPSYPVTSVEASRSDHLICITTSKDILWIDDRFTRKPVLGYKHKREFDRSLFTVTTESLTSPLTLLASRKNEFITVYDVSRDPADGLVYSNASPYSPFATNRSKAPYAGAKLLVNSQGSMTEYSLVRLSERGGLDRTDFQHFEGNMSAGDLPTSNAEQSADVPSMGDEGRLRPDVGPLGGREFSQIDLRPVYERLMIHGIGKDPEEDPEAVYEILEKMPTFKQNLDEPVDNVLTMFDIAFRSGDEPDEISRSDFLTQSSLNSARGYRALMLGRIPKCALIKQFPWHKDITSFLRHFDCDGDHPEETVEQLRRYDLASPPERAGPSYRLEAEARERLTLDLALSSDVFSVNSFRKPSASDLDDAFETMSRATENMSLSVSEPPPVHFGYLRPAMKDAKNHYPMVDGKEQPPMRGASMEMPLGARLLLQEWDVDGDPDSYVYQDPYDTAGSTPTITPFRSKPAAEASRNSSRPERETQRPPVIVAARTLAPPVPSLQTVPRPAAVQSQEPMAGGRTGATTQLTPANSQSQDMFMTNTQILPGPFGGRVPVGKKKAAKKRMGGF